MNHHLKMFTIILFALGLLIVPAMSISPIVNVNAQSQSATQQQTSSPTTSQNSSTPQVGQVFTYNEKSLPPNDPQKCAALASVVKGKAVPDYNLCDVVVYRQAPPIVRHDNLVMNNFSGLGHYIEMVPAVVNNTGT